MTSQGCRNPILIDPAFWALRFDRWLRACWPLFHSLRIAPGTNPSSWTFIFNSWLVTLCTEHISSPSPPQQTPSDAGSAPTNPCQASEHASASAPSASRNNKHYRNETSALTVQQIQDACTTAGGDADAIQQLAIMFPPGSAITRDVLKVDRKRNYHGYQEFSNLVNGRWYCRLCNSLTGHTYANQKDILDHVWNKHCDPPPASR